MVGILAVLFKLFFLPAAPAILIWIMALG